MTNPACQIYVARGGPCGEPAVGMLFGAACCESHWQQYAVRLNEQPESQWLIICPVCESPRQLGQSHGCQIPGKGRTSTRSTWLDEDHLLIGEFTVPTQAEWEKQG